MPLIPDLGLFAQFGMAGLILGVFFFLFKMASEQNAKTLKAVVDRLSTEAQQSDMRWQATFHEHSMRSDMRQGETNEVLRDMAETMGKLYAKL